MATELSTPYPVSDFLYERIYRVVADLEKKGRRAELEFFLATVDVTKTIFLSTGMLASKKNVKNLLTSSSTFEFNQRLNRMPRKLFGL